MKFSFPKALAFVMVSGASFPAAAQFAKPEDAVRYRKAAFTLLGDHFVRVAAMSSGRVPFDPAVAIDSSEAAAYVGRLPYRAFVDGSDKGETQARPEIWSDKARFNAAAERSQRDLAALSAAAKSGDLARLKAAVGAASQSCKSCHDDFRRRGSAG